MSNVEMHRIIEYLKAQGWTMAQIGEFFEYISK